MVDGSDLANQSLVMGIIAEPWSLGKRRGLRDIVGHSALFLGGRLGRNVGHETSSDSQLNSLHYPPDSSLVVLCETNYDILAGKAQPQAAVAQAMGKANLERVLPGA